MITVKNYGSEVVIDPNISEGEFTNDRYISKSMEEYAGKTAHVKEVIIDSDGVWYKLDIDHGEWFWFDDCFKAED